MADSSITVIGAGSWGTALAILLCHNLPGVTLLGRSNADALIADRCNRRYLPDNPFPDNLSVARSLEDAIQPALNFLLVTPSHGFSDTVSALRAQIVTSGHDPTHATLLWGTKGLDPTSGKLLSEVVEGRFSECDAYGTITGPSFARETASGLPTGLTLACNRRAVTDRLAPWFRTPSTRVYASDDLIGVQIGGAVKNVLAIATGISDGLGFGANARAALITRGLAEMIRFGVAHGASPETFSGLAGIGDLILTCTDDQSRNRRCGLGIGAGKTIKEIQSEIGQQIEGLRTTSEVHRKARTLGVEMPITEQVYRVIHEGLSPKQAVRELLDRQPARE